MEFSEIYKIENETERVKKTYEIFNEDTRLNRSKASRVEFYTNVKYIEKYLKEGDRILDIGAGAGFPSIPLKIVYPELKITIVDSLNKRINFLQEVIKELNLEMSAIIS